MDSCKYTVHVLDLYFLDPGANRLTEAVVLLELVVGTGRDLVTHDYNACRGVESAYILDYDFGREWIPETTAHVYTGRCDEWGAIKVKSL
jgi:hypothetical protein